MGEERLRSSKFARNVDLSAAGCIEHLSGEMLGSRQRRLHRSDKFQLSLCQRDCTSIRETKLFPFHGKKRERERERREGKSRQRAQLYRSRDSTHSIAFLSLERRRIEIRLLFARRLTTDGIQGSRHVSRRSPVSTIPSGNGASIV